MLAIQTAMAVSATLMIRQLTSLCNIKARDLQFFSHWLDGRGRLENEVRSDFRNYMNLPRRSAILRQMLGHVRRHMTQDERLVLEKSLKESGFSATVHARAHPEVWKPALLRIKAVLGL